MGKVKQKKDSGKDYTLEELINIKEYGPMPTYEDGYKYAEEHLQKTGRERSGHALYMCSWRIFHGKYDHILSAN